MKKSCMLPALVLLFVTFAEGGMAMEITSPEFKNNGYIPQRFSCDGEGINPALNIKAVPEAAKSLALIVDDPDAPMGTYVHWVVFDITPVAQIAENSVPGKQGINTSRSNNYVAPCPPSGVHRYFFKLYALDTMLNLKEGISKGALEKAIEGHILEQAQTIGLYGRNR